MYTRDAGGSLEGLVLSLACPLQLVQLVRSSSSIFIHIFVLSFFKVDQTPKYVNVNDLKIMRNILCTYVILTVK